jgi:hypothetical protein
MEKNFNLKSTVATITILLISNIIFAQMAAQLNYVCYNIKQTVPVIALLMFILSGAIYAIGQIMGAETRSRATVWSTAMLLGGIIGLIIAASAQFLLTAFANFSLGNQVTSLQTEGWCGPYSMAP